MSYPGNPSLGDEVRERILATFGQTLDLAAAGEQAQARQGCDFILQMDPLFQPATTLRQRLDAAPAGATIQVSDLAVGGGAPGGAPVASAQAEADALFDLDGAPGSGGLEDELDALLAARDHEGVMARAEQNREAVTASPRLREIVQTAQARLEARPYVETFLQKAETAAAAGDRSQVEALLDKARSLDPTHPGIARLEAAAAPPSTPSAPSADDEMDDWGDLDFGDEELSAPSLDAVSQSQELDLTDDDWAIDDPAPAPGPAPSTSAPSAPAPPSTPVTPPPSVDPPAPADSGFGGLDLDAGLDLPDLDFGADAPDLGMGDPASSEGAADAFAGLGPLDSPAGPAATTSGPGANDSSDRISQLLADGQAAFDTGDYQAAIDAWSRIFLIDVDHREAADRIEQARRMKAEQERQVEEIYHDALAKLEAGDLAAARERFVRVLDLQPNHLASREYVQQIDSGQPIEVSPAVQGVGGSGMAGGVLDFSDMDMDAGDGTRSSGDSPLKEEILVPPSPSAAPAAGDPDAIPTPESLGVEPVDGGATPAFRGSAAKKERSPRTFLIIAAVVLVAVLGGLWFLWQNSGDLFPNSTPEEGPVDGPAASQVEQARTLYERGSTGLALRRLRSLRPEHPEYAQAQELIAQWEADAPADLSEVAGIDPAISQRRDLLLAAAAQAMDDGDPRRAVELYEGADGVAPLDDQSADRLAEARSILAPLSTEIELFEARDYQVLLPRLWRLREEDPSDALVEDLIVDTYYNMGVRELQRGDPRQALEHFQEARELAPDDEALRRNTLLAETYSSQPRDRLYEIYVKYLPFR